LIFGFRNIIAKGVIPLLRRVAGRVDGAIAYSGQLSGEERHQENLKFLEGATRLYPDSAELQLLYARTLLEFQPDDVASEVVKAVGLAPDDPTILTRAAHLMLSEGEPGIARFYTQRARELAGSNFIFEGGIANLEGHFAAIDKEYGRAEERFRFAVEVDPDFESFSRNLARLLAIRGRLEEAVEVVDQALPQVKTKRYLEEFRERLMVTVKASKNS
jgi:tetratricopeptide (TPR) repeat protein